MRVPVAEAFEVYANAAARIVAVSEAAIAEAMRILYRTTHNLAEGAGAAALAAALQEKTLHRDRSIGVILSGANVDAELFAQVLAGATPAAG